MGVRLGLSHLRKEHRLKVFKNRVLRKIFWPKGDEVIRE
jgi:preprotein translocase subunit SecE